MYNNILIEVKCPFKYRNEKFCKCLLNQKDYILSYNGSSFVLNEKHNYYDQVQGQLYISKKEKCILVLWSTVDYLEFVISKDCNWANNVNILKEFYNTKYLDYILK